MLNEQISPELVKDNIQEQKKNIVFKKYFKLEYLNLVKQYKKYKTNQKLKKFKQEQNIKKQQLLLILRHVLEVIKYIDKHFPNRQQRKQFWREFVRDKKVREEIIIHLLESIEGKVLMDFKEKLEKIKRGSYK